MFLGEYAHTIDDKGRLTVPARFRDQLAGGAVVTRGFDRHLILYTIESFEKLVQKARALTNTDPENRALNRLLFSGASEVTLDRSNRINLPAFLRDFAGLDSDVMVVGAGDYAEIWSQAGWQDQLLSVNDPVANARRFATLNLATAS
ncbi:MAG: division/cell wall cluster transcriptional repressor MraZ [Chloroflexi bacterium]|nr:division/cell wall cluster transcriptional repressor MraZ [Chloroflexota bacterium]